MDRQSKKKAASSQGTDTEVFCLMGTSNSPVFDPEENPGTMTM